MQIMHKTYPGSGALCTGSAAMIAGTLVNELLRRNSLKKGIVRIGHPGGIMEVESGVEKVDDKFIVTKNAMYRTARKIMDGYVYVRRKLLE